ncbi:MAG: ATP-dependent chaperone ClpB, partial [Magnetovibrio sp.]|nr:ATP-dependent chaperone ClpB [Magnetovibrio sp.]
ANQQDGHDSVQMREPVMEVVRAAFRPEFLNRLDEVILFHRLFRDHMDAIVEIQLERLFALLDDKQISLDLDGAARAWLADNGYDPIYGARPLKRTIQRALQNPLAGLILEGKLKDGDTVSVSAGSQGLTINGEDVAEWAA